MWCVVHLGVPWQTMYSNDILQVGFKRRRPNLPPEIWLSRFL